jgi:hypothetical protein
MTKLSQSTGLNEANGGITGRFLSEIATKELLNDMGLAGPIFAQVLIIHIHNFQKKKFSLINLLFICIRRGSFYKI